MYDLVINSKEYDIELKIGLFVGVKHIHRPVHISLVHETHIRGGHYGLALELFRQD